MFLAPVLLAVSAFCLLDALQIPGSHLSQDRFEYNVFEVYPQFLSICAQVDVEAATTEDSGFSSLLQIDYCLFEALQCVISRHFSLTRGLFFALRAAVAVRKNIVCPVSL